MSKELLDLVDENDDVIGSKLRSEVKNEGLTNIRVVNVFLINPKGQLWIPKRSPTKKAFPSCLDMSMGGYVSSGESYEEALKRELAEELNINVDKVMCRFLGYLTPEKDQVACFMKVYEIKTGEAPNYNPEDFTEYYWLRPKEVISKIECGEKAKHDLPVLVKALYLDK